MKVRARRTLTYCAAAGALAVCAEGTECEVIDRTPQAIAAREDGHERALLRHNLIRTQGETGQVWFVWEGLVRFGEVGNEVEYVVEPGAGLPLNHREAGGTRVRGTPAWAKQAT